MPGFLKLFCPQTLVYVCVSAPRVLITSHVKGTRNNWIWQFYGFLFLYMTLAVDKLNGCGFSNTACRECLPKKTKVMYIVLATEGLPGSTNKTEQFNYKGEWANVH